VESGVPVAAQVSVKVTVRSNDQPHVRWLLASLLVPCAMAQTPEADERRRDQWRQQEEQQRRAQEEMQRQQQKAAEEEKRQRDEASDRSRKETEEWLKKEAPRRQAQAAQSAKQAADAKALRQEMMRLPPLADDSNVLLGRWRLEGGGPNSSNAARDQAILTGKGFGVGGANVGLGDLMGMLADLESGKTGCDVSFGRGITFAPTTYSSGGVAGMAGGPVAYRSRNKQVIVAIPGDSRAVPMPFEVSGPNRIVWGGTCALVRVGAPAADAAANATTAPGNPRTAPASGGLGAVVDGAAFRCADGSLLHVSFCQGDAPEANCKLAELHLPGLQMGKMARRTDIAARVKGCEAGGIRYGADDKPVFVR
jgi:hypothetical protein